MKWNGSWHAEAWLFPAVLAVSALAHFMLVRYLALPSGVQRIDFENGGTTEVFIIEEPPPIPEPPPAPPADPIPEPEPPRVEPEEPEPPQIEEILTTAKSEQVAAPEPTPETRRAEEKPPPQRQRPPAAPKTANVPMPVLISNKPPYYPEIARRSGWEGKVVVRAEVSQDGFPTSVIITKSSGYGVLDQAALRSVKSWRFQPRTIGGVAMTGVVEVPVNFSLNR